MANSNTLEIIQGLSQAAANAYDGVHDERFSLDGQVRKIGLRREEGCPIMDSRVMDGFSVKFYGNKMCINYQSDIRLKENVKGLKSPLEKVCNMEGYNYNFKSNPDVPRSGLIAQELEQVVPELVETDEKGMKSANYIDVIPYLIESIKELKQMIEK